MLLLNPINVMHGLKNELIVSRSSYLMTYEVLETKNFNFKALLKSDLSIRRKIKIQKHLFKLKLIKIKFQF